jgi:glycosyltransferase involved in cell wall biosynthesis
VTAPTTSERTVDTLPPRSRRPLLTVVVPVYNEGPRIVENLSEIRSALAGRLNPDDVELIVVSDGSVDDTAERLLEAQGEIGMRVLHYDRNLGKGYAVKVGALAGQGEWIGLVDADLDLDPAALPDYLDIAQREQLDFAIGSKRHPDSTVFYPRSRRVASWCYQQLNRVLFRLDVRDTQVGLKVFSREVVDDVLPLLLVKQFAFDLELLAVARAFGYDRVQELPVRLDYRFTGSGVGSRAVARALWDTAAVFYRLRILRTYQRKRQLLGSAPLPDEAPGVTLIGNGGLAAGLEYPRIEVAALDERAEAARTARGEMLAFLAPGARPASNWLSAAVPYLAQDDIACVIVPAVTPASASLRERAAGAILESRLGAGSRRPRYFPGNIRILVDEPVSSFVVRRTDYLAAIDAGVTDDRLVSWLAERGRRTIYTPDSMIAAAPAPLVEPHLHATYRHAVSRGAAARASLGASSSAATALSLAPAVCATLGAGLLTVRTAPTQRVGAVLVGGYGLAVAATAVLAGRRFRSPLVGLLAAPGFVLTHTAYVAGFARGVARRR